MTITWKPKTKWYEDEIALKEQDAAWYEQPKRWWESAEETMGEKISKIPVLPKILEPIGKAFGWVHENIEKPLAAILTSPWSPEIPWKEGESWLEHQKREYEAWDAPTYVKGFAEVPIWFLPWFSWIGAGAKALGAGTKVARSMKALKVGEQGLPVNELLYETLFRAGRLTKAMKKVPVVNRIVTMLGGPAAFVTQKEAKRILGLVKEGRKLPLLERAKWGLPEQDALTFSKMNLVTSGFISSKRDDIARLLVPKLQVIEYSGKGGIQRVLGIGADNTASKIVSKESAHWWDALEGAARESYSKVPKSQRKFKIVDKETQQYVDTLADIYDDLFKLGQKEGVKLPKKLTLHRLIDRKSNAKTGAVERTEFGSGMEYERIYETVNEALEHAAKEGSVLNYNFNVGESITSTIHSTINKIAKKRFEKEVGRVGKTAKNLWETSVEGQRYNKLKYAESIGVINQTERAELRVLVKEREMHFKHYAGREAFSRGETPQLMKFDTKSHVAFGGKLFPKDVVKSTQKVMDSQGQAWLSVASGASGQSRMLVAAMDLSAPFIQGAAVFGRNPAAWGKMVEKNIEFFLKPENYYKWLNKPEVLAANSEMILKGGMSASTFEFFKALAPLQRFFGKKFFEKTGTTRPIRAGITQTYGRAEVAFSGGGLAARTYMWDAIKLGRKKPWTDAELLDLGRSLDRMTGVMSTEAIGITRTQQDFESAFMFFAPRYTRAGLTLTGDVLKGGLTGAEARKAFGGMAAGGLSMYMGITKALGQQPNLDPSSARFMTIKIGNSYVGVGGIMTAITRLGYDVAAETIESIADKRLPSYLQFPIKDGKLDRRDNAFIKFMYNRTSPLTSALYGGVIEQANYFGEPFESIQDWGKFMLDKVTPIASQEVTDWLVQGKERPEATALGAEFAGLRRFPKSAWELLDDQRDEASIREYSKPYEELNNLERMRVNKEGAVKELQTEVDRQTVIRGDKEQVAFIEWEREKDYARSVYEEQLWNLQRAYDAGEINGWEFKEKMGDAAYGMGQTYEHINSQYPEVMEIFKEPKNLQDRSVEDIAYQEYQDKKYSEDDFIDQYGLFDYDKYYQFLEDFKGKWGEQVWGYVKEIEAERNENLPPLAKEYQIAKEVLKPYWDIERELIERRGKFFVESPAGQRLITQMRRQLRLRDPQIAYYYEKFLKRS